MATNEGKVMRKPRHTALRQNTLTESIYQEIKARLQRGQITRHDRVLDYEIAEEFACTRMPARQALLRLVNEGYMVGTTRGFVVPVMSEADIHDIFELRRMLEPEAAAGVAGTLTGAQLEALEHAYERVCQANEEGSVEKMVESNIAFRDIWLSGVRNERLRTTIERFVDHAQQVRLSTMTSRETRQIIVDTLKPLLEAFLSRDAECIKSKMIDLMKRAEERYFLAVREDEADKQAG